MNRRALARLGASLLAVSLHAAAADAYRIDAAAAARAAQRVVLGEFFSEMMSPAGYAAVRELGHGDAIRDGRYFAPEGLFDILLPPLGTGRVDVYRAVRARRPDGAVAVAHVRFRDAAGWLAAVVAERVPEGYPRDARLLDEVERSQRALHAGRGSQAPEVRRLDGALGPALEVVVRNREADPFFPYAAAQVSGAPDLASVSVERFVVRDGVLLGFALLVPRPAGMGEQAFLEFARGEADRFMSGLGGV
ncbi:MAG: hypothetical protein N2544_03470 [Burkholderiales bacterium]|nr:hypothetical protein [Burkholderiales bacterium]